MLFFSYSSVSVSKSELGTLSDCAAEFASTRLHIRASSVTRAVVKESTAFLFSYIRGSEIFVGNVRGPAEANATADALMSNLRTRQTGAQSKGYTPDFSHPDLLRTVLHAL